MKFLPKALLLFGVVIALIGVAGYWSTSQKIQKMEMIRGLRPGADYQNVKITNKLRTETALEFPTYWGAWNNSDIATRSNERLNLPSDLWSQIEIGSTMRVAFIAGDQKPYHPDGVFASDGNFTFDRILQMIEITIIAFGVLLALSPIPITIFTGRSVQSKEAADSNDSDSER